VRALVLVATVVFTCCGCRGSKEAAPLVRVPELRGLPTQEALHRLARAELCVWRIDREAGRGSGPERVVAQRPLAGTRVRRLRRVSLRVSALPPEVEILDLVTAEGCPQPPVTR
jgi:beta-lactam-binding protein with PASTA domain